LFYQIAPNSQFCFVCPLSPACTQRAGSFPLYPQGIAGNCSLDEVIADDRSVGRKRHYRKKIGFNLLKSPIYEVESDVKVTI
jgi:hypothetical protein